MDIRTDSRIEHTKDVTTVYHQKGTHLLQQLMGECMTYGPYNTSLRKIFFNSQEKDLFEEEPNEVDPNRIPKLSEMFEDRDVSDEEFMETLRKRKAEGSPDFDEYKKYIRELDFEEPRK